MKILVVRFRQMGDAILATPLLTTLKNNVPGAEIDFVLNARIAPLFEGHPAISRIITFTDEERHSSRTYIKKVRQIVRRGHYDAIIDMRSTVNTMLFALLSPRTPLRIGIRKPYTWAVFNHRYEGCNDDESMISHNLRLAEPIREWLQKKAQPTTGWHDERNLSLPITQQEKTDFRQYMQQQGIDFSRPVLLVGVTAKLASKTWPEDRMTDTLRHLIDTFPTLQLIFNYAPGKEAENAQRIYEALSPSKGSRGEIFLHISAKTPRQLAAMAANCTAYFGNEGGARHIVHAMGRPSLVVCSPGASKTTWLPTDTSIPAIGIDAPSYDAITVERVWNELQDFCHKYLPTQRKV